VVPFDDGELDQLVGLVRQSLKDGHADAGDADPLRVAEGEREEAPAQVEVPAPSRRTKPSRSMVDMILDKLALP